VLLPLATKLCNDAQSEAILVLWMLLEGDKRDEIAEHVLNVYGMFWLNLFWRMIRAGTAVNAPFSPNYLFYQPHL
jgi:hypothetical protein